jgi:ribonuclease HII
LEPLNPCLNLKKIPFNLRIEKSIWKRNTKYIAGVDEAGRGPLAGPVVAAAVIFKPNDYIPDIKDSKELSPKQRDSFSNIIMERAMAVGVGIINSQIIDEINIRQATLQAMQKAINSLSIKPEYLLIDGRDVLENLYEQQAIIDGDNLCFTISAASIIAKVIRDRLMMRFHNKYPQFGFSHNKGYATQFHRNMIKKFGPCSIHRKTFLTKIFAEQDGIR